MNFTPVQMAKAKKAKSVEELLKIAKENGIEMTEEQANEYFAELHKTGELTDDELDAVAGGNKGDPPASRFSEGDWVSEMELYFYKIVGVTWTGSGYEYRCLIVQEFPNDGTRGAGGYVTRTESEFSSYQKVNYAHADEFINEVG